MLTLVIKDGYASVYVNGVLDGTAGWYFPGLDTISKVAIGKGPADGIFVGGYENVCEWAPHLDRSFVPIQGPPGTGKTFTGAHVIHTLVKAGKRVGVTAMSHPAIDNLIEAVVERFAQEGDELRAVRKAKKGSVSGVEYIDDNPKCATGPYDVIAGTSWLFANQAMRDNPVDVLVVDEAGQLGLADTLAATISATNVILLGVPFYLYWSRRPTNVVKE